MQEGFTRLWRGTGASLALAVPSVSSLSCIRFILLYNFLSGPGIIWLL